MGIGLELELGFRPMGSCRFMPLAASRVGSSTAREGVGTPRSLADGRATTSSSPASAAALLAALASASSKSAVSASKSSLALATPG